MFRERSGRVPEKACKESRGSSTPAPRPTRGTIVLTYLTMLSALRTQESSVFWTLNLPVTKCLMSEHCSIYTTNFFQNCDSDAGLRVHFISHFSHLSSMLNIPSLMLFLLIWNHYSSYIILYDFFIPLPSLPYFEKYSWVITEVHNGLLSVLLLINIYFCCLFFELGQ